MTRSPIARRAFGALLAGLTFLLASCGGSGNDNGGNATLRVVNATSDLASVDVYTNANKSFPAVNAGVMTDSQGLGAATYTVMVTSAGNQTALFSGSYSLSGGQHYTGVVWGRNGSLKFATLPEDEDVNAIAAGSSRVRAYNATSDAGAFDIYLTQGVDDLNNASPAISAAATGTLTGYKDVSAGTYRLRITAAGDASKVRLDVPAVTLTERQYASIIITAGSGGVLVNGALLVQQGTYTTFANTQARLRVVPGVAANGIVSVQLDGQTVAASLRSPPSVVAPYFTVAAGNRAVNVVVNGVSVSNTTRTLAAGADYTLLVYGPAATPLNTLVADDNRLPATGRYKIRMVNGVTTFDPLTLTVDFSPVIGDLPAGSASSYYTGIPSTSTAGTQLTVTSISATTALYDKAVTLQAAGVYTLFMLEGNPTPSALLVKEP